jgi:hypothetical protein
MKTTVGKIGVFFMLIGGIFAYLNTGVSLFQKIKNGTINLELKAIDRALLAEKFQSNKFPTHFKKFMSESFETKMDKKVGTDPWSNDYNYTLSKQGYTIVSNGPNGIFGDKDDIISKRIKDTHTIEIQAASDQLKAKKVAGPIVKVEKESSLVDDLMKVLDLQEIIEKRPIEKMTDEEFASIIMKFLKENDYE